MTVIGITGLPCSGKSLAAALLADGSVDGARRLLLKADDIGHEVLSRPEVLALLTERFGAETTALAEPAALRRAIAARVFSNPDELLWLESVVHPRVDATIVERIGKASEGAVVEAAMLFAAHMEERCDRVLVVEAPFDVRLARAASRGWDKAELERRERRQIPLIEAAWRGPSRAKLRAVANAGSREDLLHNIKAALAS